MTANMYRAVKNKILAVLWIAMEVLSEFLLGLVYRNKHEALPPIKSFILLESAQSLASKIRARKLKSEDLVRIYIERIQDVNPIVNAVVDNCFDEAIKEAKKVDELILSGQKTDDELLNETPFLGVPFTMKECFQCKGLHQTSGLVARRDIVADDDAPVVARMKKAGAILLCVTNVSEMCMWWESHNRVYGRTNNPYNTSRCCGGSSGGEGCIIGSAGSVMGFGSDVGGSIRIPAYFNGIFGHKASTGIIPNDGQIPRGGSTEINYYLCTGPLCRYASDLVPIMKVLGGPKANVLQFDKPVDLKNLKFFYIENAGMPLVSSVHPELKEAIKKVVTYLDKAHGIKAKKIDIPELRYSGIIWDTKMSVGSNVSFSVLLNNGEGEVNVILELLKWCMFCSNHTLPALLLCLFEKTVKKNPSYLSFVDKKTELLLQRIQDLLGNDGILLFPPVPTLVPYHNQPLFTPGNYRYMAIFNILGLPVTQCPLGLSTDGLPLGIQVISNLHCDRMTLAVALELEKAFGGWVSPSPTP